MQIYKIELDKTKNGNTSCSHKNYLSSRVRNGRFFKSPIIYTPYPIAIIPSSSSADKTPTSHSNSLKISLPYIFYFNGTTMVSGYVEHVPHPFFQYVPSSPWNTTSLSYIRTLLAKPSIIFLCSLLIKDRLD